MFTSVAQHDSKVREDEDETGNDARDAGNARCKMQSSLLRGIMRMRMRV